MIKNLTIKRCIALIYCISILISVNTSVYAETEPDNSVDCSIISSINIDGDKFYKPVSEDQNQILRKEGEKNNSSNVKIKYESKDKNLKLSINLDDNGKKTNINAEGIVYSNISADYDKSIIVDLNTSSLDYTIVFLQLFYDNECGKAKIIVERNDNGETFIITVKIQDNIFYKIYQDSLKTQITEEMYYSIVTDAEKSPNYGGMYKNRKSYEVSSLYDNNSVQQNSNANDNLSTQQNSDVNNSFSVQQDLNNMMTTTTVYNSRSEWVNFFNYIYASSGFVSTGTYFIDSTIFTEITPTLGAYQWKDTSNDFYYKVVRLALYQSYTNTYSLYLSLLGCDIITTGNNINFKFGMYQKSGEQLNTATCRTEYNKSTDTIRYVADYGIKFASNISIGLYNSSNCFMQISRSARISENPNAWSLCSFAIGFIPSVGNVVGLCDSIYNTYKINEPITQDWYYNGTRTNAATLDLGRSGQALYKKEDFETLNTYTYLYNSQARFEWDYTCYLP